jgi:hypothetical protein
LTENGIIIRDVTNKIQWIAMLGIKGITASATKGEDEGPGQTATIG